LGKRFINKLMAREVVLINPPVKKIVERRYDRPAFPHLGLAYVASYLISKQIRCRVIDAKLEAIDPDTIIKRLKSIDPGLIGITSMTHEIENAHFLAEEIKLHLPLVKIVVGGVHATVLPSDTLKEYPSFDFAIIGEGEETMFELARNGGAHLDTINGLCYRRDGKIVMNAPREKIRNLDELPFPAWELFPVAKEYPIMTARGCPFNCIFCANPNGNVVRKRSARRIIDEFEMTVNRYNPKRIVFWDEALAIDRDRINEMLDLLIQKKLNRRVSWYAQTHVNTVDYPLFKKMKEAGCVHIGLGIESGNEKILDSLNKGITLAKIKSAVAAAKKAGLPVEGYFILGHPDETKKTALDTINLAVKLNPEYPVFGIMTPYPGTKVMHMAENNIGGYRLISHKWSDYNKQLGNALELRNLTRKELEYLQLRSYISVFILNFRIIGLINFAIKYRKEAVAFLNNFLFKKKINRHAQ